MAPAELSGLHLSQSFVTIPLEGGTTSIKLNTSDSKFMVKKMPQWAQCTTTLLDGTKGEYQLDFSAEATLDGRLSDSTYVEANGQKHLLRVMQGLPVANDATCAQVIAGPDGKTYRVKGIVTRITNTVYGNWYLQDATGEILIYGTLDKDGKEKNFASLGIEEGDEVTVQGPKTTYKGEVELVNVSVVKISKSLVKVESVSMPELPIEGGTTVVTLSCKGEGVSVDIPEAAKNWLSIKTVKQYATGAEVTLMAQPNAGGDRNTSLTFTTTSGGKTYSTKTNIKQKGAIVAATVQQFISAAEGDAQYRITGSVSNLKSNGSFKLTDFSGSVDIYKAADVATKGLKDGDIVTIVGKRSSYNGTPQMAQGGVLETVNSVTVTTIADVLTRPDNDNVWYTVTGKIESITNDTYGNMTLSQDGSSIYLYGLYAGYGASGDARKGVVAAKGLAVGQTITVTGTKTTYTAKDGTVTLQMKNSFLVAQ